MGEANKDEKCPECGSELKFRFERKGKYHGIQHTYCVNEKCGWGEAEPDCMDDKIIREMQDRKQP